MGLFNNDSSGQSSGFSIPLVAVIGICCLLIGGLLGYKLSGGEGGAVPQSSRSSQNVSGVSGSTLSDMANNDSSQAGAVRAATTFVVALPDLSARPVLSRSSDLERVYDRRIDDTSRARINSVLNDLNHNVVNNGGTVTSRVVTSPAIYKVAVANNIQTVTIWYSLTVADPTNLFFRTMWQTANISLSYNGKWQVTSFQFNYGPTPALFSANGQSGDFNSVQPLLDRSFAYSYGPFPSK